MTALAVVEGLGTALSLITWGIDRFPEQPPKNSLLRVALGLNDGKVQNAGGLSPNVWAYDALENQIGMTADPWIGRPIIDDGNFDDITIFHKADKERTQSRYINVEADVSGDLICIAYMTLTWADSGKHGWNGDLGKICDQPWYPSHVVIGEDDYEVSRIFHMLISIRLLHSHSPPVHGLVMAIAGSRLEFTWIWLPLALNPEMQSKARITTVRNKIIINPATPAIGATNPYHLDLMMRSLRCSLSVGAINTMVRRMNFAPVSHRTVPVSSPQPNTPSVTWRPRHFGLYVMIVPPILALASIWIHIAC